MIGRVCWRFAKVDSTQKVAFRLAELSAPHGTVVRADYQSSGRGRLGRRWEASPGSALMFSIILRPTQPMQALIPVSILAADVLADVLAEFLAEPVNIKWPNDVLIHGKKVSGILMQTRVGPDPVAVLGIGINVRSSLDSLPPGATSLDRHVNDLPDTEELLGLVLRRLGQLWASLRPELTPTQVARLDSRLWLNGEKVSILDANREIEGSILGVARSGGLRLWVNGAEREIVAGEIQRGPRPIGSL